MQNKIKQYLTENGIIDAVQSQLKQGLAFSSVKGKAIDNQTAQAIKKIWDQGDQEVAARKKKKIANMSGKSETDKKPITESLILTRRRYHAGGIAPTNVKGTKENGLKGVLDKDRGTLDVTLQQARANNGQQVGNRAAVKKPFQESDNFGYVKPLPRKLSGKAIEAMNEKNVLLNNKQTVKSHHDKQVVDATKIDPKGVKYLRQLTGQTNQNGYGIGAQYN